MPSSSRHRTNAPGWYFTGQQPTVIYELHPTRDNAQRVRWPRVSRLVHFLLRVEASTSSPERRQPGPMANQCYGSPVDERLSVDPFLALLSDRRLPNQSGRS